MSAAPARIHQRLSLLITRLLGAAVEDTGWGEVYYAPVDVRFTEIDQVQPDLLVIRKDRLDIYQGHIVHGAPDIVVEILSPSNRTIDLVEKARLYAEHGVPEYWILDPIEKTFQLFRHEGGQHVLVAPENGISHSAVIPGLAIDPAELFAKLESE